MGRSRLVDLMNRKGLTRELLKTWGIEYSKDSISIPFEDPTGVSIGYVVRELEPKRYSFPSASILYPFGLLRAKPMIDLYGFAVLVESPFDVIALQGAEMPAIGANTASLTIPQAVLIAFVIQKVSIFFDFDVGGKAGSQQAAKLLSSGGVRTRLSLCRNSPSDALVTDRNKLLAWFTNEADYWKRFSDAIPQVSS